MLAEYTIEINGINSAYGIIVLAALFFGIYFIKSLFTAFVTVLRAFKYLLCVHWPVTKIIWRDRFDFSAGLLLFAAIGAGVYIGNYHLRGPDFDMSSGWFSVPALLLGIVTLFMIGSIYSEATVMYWKRGMTETQAKVFDLARKCEQRATNKGGSTASRGSRKDRCRVCEHRDQCLLAQRKGYLG